MPHQQLYRIFEEMRPHEAVTLIAGTVGFVEDGQVFEVVGEEHNREPQRVYARLPPNSLRFIDRVERDAHRGEVFEHAVFGELSTFVPEMVLEMTLVPW